MSNAIVLDALFVVIGVLFIAIGFRRGLLREVFVSAAVLVAMVVSGDQAATWAESIAGWFNLGLDTATFLAIVGILLFALLVLGYGTVYALDLEVSAGDKPLSGALAGLINGALIFSVLLSATSRHIADDGSRRTLDQSRIASLLIDHADGLVLGSALLVAIVVLMAAFFRSSSGMPRQSAERNRQTTGSISAQRRSPRLKWGRDGDKVEPGLSTVGAFGSDTYANTIPIAPGITWSTDRARSESTRGPEWMEIKPEYQSSPVPESRGTPRCTGCGELINTIDDFCPRCGRATR